MATLTEAQKTFIVQELARFLRPSDVVESVKEKYDIEVSRQQVWNYLPDSPQIAARWVDLFHKTREQFIKDTSSIGVSHLAYRLTLLQQMCHRAMGMRNYALAASILEQAAKDVGGAFTNKRELGGMGGGPVPLSVALEESIAKVYGQEELDKAKAEMTPSEVGADDSEDVG